MEKRDRFPVTSFEPLESAIPEALSKSLCSWLHPPVLSLFFCLSQLGCVVSCLQQLVRRTTQERITLGGAPSS